VKGKGSVPEWVKTRERNEALDLTVYSLAALYILGPVVLNNLPERAAQLARPVSEVQAEMAAKPEPPKHRHRWGQTNWMNSWRYRL